MYVGWNINKINKQDYRYYNFKKYIRSNLATTRLSIVRKYSDLLRAENQNFKTHRHYKIQTAFPDINCWQYN
jgi:hypothetical protein